MNSLPTDLQSIIYKYIHQLSFKGCLDDINNIEYTINNDLYTYKSSTIKINSKQINLRHINDTNNYINDEPIETEFMNLEHTITHIPSSNNKTINYLYDTENHKLNCRHPHHECGWTIGHWELSYQRPLIKNINKKYKYGGQLRHPIGIWYLSL